MSPSKEGPKYMTERDESAPSEGDPIAAEVGERVTAVLSAAEAAANAIRHEAEQQAQIRRRAAEAEAVRYAEEKRREADDLLAQRVRRISEVSDELIRRAESIVAQFDEAGTLKRQLEALVTALGDASEQLAKEMSESERPALSLVREEEEAAAAADAAESSAAEEPSAAKADPVEERAPEVAPEPVRRGPDEPDLSAVERLKAASASRDEEAEAAMERRGRFSQPEHAGEPPPPADEQLLGARLVALQMAVAGSERSAVDRHLRSEFDLQDPSGILDEVFGKADSTA
jgi:hypothetical protein